MRNNYWLIILCIFHFVLFANEKPIQLRIVSTANVHGETDPCG